MRERSIQLSTQDTLILESYKTLIDGLAEYLGEGFEFVLHSLENLDRSVIKIINGYHTGRKEGAPITDLALSMLAEIEKSLNSSNITYFNKNKKGQPLKATTIAIRGKGGRVIGLLCINFYLNTPVADFLGAFVWPSNSKNETVIRENFAESTDELIAKSLAQVKKEITSDDAVPPTNKNKEIIARLYENGIFKLKDAVQVTANLLGISRNTVYMHIRNLS